MGVLQLHTINTIFYFLLLFISVFWYNREHQDFKGYQESEDCLVFLAHLDHRELVEYQVFQELKYIIQ